mmetsp:Transcript_10323/g.22986  ORF Transcript_10323/g.22986 Transcript_10323/m.22986 type:complete len:248 (-) Transcript_10323:32-775(-)
MPMWNEWSEVSLGIATWTNDKVALVGGCKAQCQIGQITTCMQSHYEIHCTIRINSSSIIIFLNIFREIHTAKLDSTIDIIALGSILPPGNNTTLITIHNDHMRIWKVECNLHRQISPTSTHIQESSRLFLKLSYPFNKPRCLIVLLCFQIFRSGQLAMGRYQMVRAVWEIYHCFLLAIEGCYCIIIHRLAWLAQFPAVIGIVISAFGFLVFQNFHVGAFYPSRSVACLCLGSFACYFFNDGIDYNLL